MTGRGAARGPAIVVLSALVASSGVADAEARPRYGGAVEATLLGAPGTLDPVAARSHAEVTIAGLVFDTLYALSADGPPRPLLAADAPVVDAAGTRVFVPLRDGLRFHDGTELSGLDVARSLQRARREARWAIPAVTAVKAEPGGIVLSLRAPAPELTTLLALPQLAVTQGGRPPGERPIGSGPYAFVRLDPARRRLDLRAFEQHVEGRPYVDTLALAWHDSPDGEARRFETGKAQVSTRGATAFSTGAPRFKANSVDSPSALLIYVGFGRAHRDVTEDRAFRRALDLAFARGGLAAITHGERVVPTRAVVPVESGGGALDAAARASDVTAALAQLAVAQRRVPALAPARLSRLQLEVLVEASRPDDREIGERVVLALDKLGIAASITALPAPALHDRVAQGACDLWIGQLALPIGAPGAWWAAAFAAGGEDGPLPALAQSTLDPVAASRELASRLPVLPLMFRGVRLWHRAALRGVSFDAAGRPSYADVFVAGAAEKASPP